MQHSKLQIWYSDQSQNVSQISIFNIALLSVDIARVYNDGVHDLLRPCNGVNHFTVNSYSNKQSKR